MLVLCWLFPLGCRRLETRDRPKSRVETRITHGPRRRAPSDKLVALTLVLSSYHMARWPSGPPHHHKIEDKGKRRGVNYFPSVLHGLKHFTHFFQLYYTKMNRYVMFLRPINVHQLRGIITRNRRKTSTAVLNHLMKRIFLRK